MDTIKDNAPYPEPSTEERPCACYSGWVFVGYIDEHSEEREASYRCRRCAGETSQSRLPMTTERGPPAAEIFQSIGRFRD